MNDSLAKIIAASTFLEAQHQEMLRRTKNEQQAKDALSKTVGHKGLLNLFPGLKVERK